MMVAKSETGKNYKGVVNKVLLVLMVISIIVLLMQNIPKIGKKYAAINKNTITLEIADNESSREKGLSGRDSLPADTGMLFIFDSADIWEFWMGGMKIALDFLWIQDKKIVDISESVLPPTQTNGIPVYLKPKTPVQYVIEVNAGWVRQHNVNIGDPIELHF